MATKKKPELRMYFLTMYNLSPIQQGIQCLHACVEYFLKHWKDKEFWRWAKTHKTVIIFNGGTSNDGTQSVYGYPVHNGSMEQHLQTLKDNKIKCAAFREPDLNYAMSSVAFLVDERVFNKKDYPDFEYTPKMYSDEIGSKNIALFESEIKERALFKEMKVKHYKEYVKSVGKDVAFLKDFLKPFRMA